MGIEKRLREERERMGHSQESAGATGGVRKQAQHLYESGERHPDTRYLLKLQAGGFDVPYILTGERTPATALQAHINAAQFTIRKELDEESVQLLAQSWVAQAPYSVQSREQEEELLRLFRAMGDQSKLSLLAVAKSFK
jgi:transcriptional regulator with XRE-family HTH domain